MNENPTSSTDAPSPPPRDIDRVDAEQWPTREFPIADGRREKSVRVVIRQSVLNDIHRHGQTRTDVEICGVIIGQGYRDERGPFIYVEGNIRGQHSDSKSAQVTFTGETWNHIHNELDTKYPDLQILGWYHTHPGFGIFLSGMDLFIHDNYFNAEHQLAFVYDPIGGDEGLFVWRDGSAIRDGYLIEPDVAEDPPPVAARPPSEPFTAGAIDDQVEPQPSSETSNANGEIHERLQRVERRLMFAEWATCAALFFLCVFPMMMWFFWIEPLHKISDQLEADGQTQRPTPISPVEPIEPHDPNQLTAPVGQPSDNSETTTTEPTANFEEPPAP